MKTPQLRDRTMQIAFSDTIRLALGLVFAASGASKIYRPNRFARGIAQYRLLPASMVHAAAYLIASLEVGLAIAHCGGYFVTVASLVGFFLLTTFGFAVIFNLRKHRAVPCQCFGPSQELISPQTVLRLILLCIGELILFITQIVPTHSAARLPLWAMLFWATSLLLAALWGFSARDLIALAASNPSSFFWRGVHPELSDNAPDVLPDAKI